MAETENDVIVPSSVYCNQDGGKALEEQLVRMVELTSAVAGSTIYLGQVTGGPVCNVSY